MPQSSRPGALSREEKQEMLKRILAKRGNARTTPGGTPNGRGGVAPDEVRADEDVPESAWRIDKFPQYLQLHLQRAVAERIGVRNPFFLLNDGVASNTTLIDGREVINFAGYNYLGLNGHPRVIAAATDAAGRWGTSASASRIVSGEKPPHRALEKAIAALHGTDDAVAFVSGYTTNVTVIATLCGPRDLVAHDRLIHNSAVQGARLSGATRHAFPHNDWQALDTFLTENRRHYERVLIVTEGLFSMDGDTCPLDKLVELKRRHKALLMVDEAHSIGAMGSQGRGVGEHFGVAPQDVDVWMGTLSKTMAGCGGYVAGCSALVELLKFSANGFVYSVGMPPPMAAASTEAIALMLAEPERVARLQANGRLFLEEAKAAGLDTGLSEGYNVVPVIIGRSLAAGRLSNALLDRGISVQPVVYPAVEEKLARLRFFITADHTAEQIRATVAAVAEELARLDSEADDA